MSSSIGPPQMDATAHGNLGRQLAARGQIDEAVPHFEAAARLTPGFAPARYNLGRALCDQGRLEESVVHFRDALRLEPNYRYAHNNLGIVLSRLGQPDEALAHLQAALLLDPNDAAAHHNRGLVLLRLGRWGEGWPEYEWRWRTTPPKSPLRDFAQPLWTGGDTPDRVVMLHAEQGFGDTLQYCRYAPLAAKRCAKVYLEVPATLLRLCAGSLSDDKVEVVPRAANFPGHERLPHFDLHCPLLSLPRVFATTLADVPAASPYLIADPADVAAWSQRLSALPGLRAGLVWAGNPQYPDDSRRSLRLAQLAPLAITGVSFVSLQKGAGAHAEAAPAGMTLLDASDDLRDFADTAAAITALDLVISVDTAAAHLAGALGKPVWLLNRFDSDWRWLVERTDTPWYPTMRIFRQPAFGDWDSVTAKVASELACFASGNAWPAGRGRKQPADPIAAHRLTVALDPASAGALNDLGRALEDIRQYAEAERCYRRALAIDPQSSRILVNVALAARRQGDLDEALALLLRAATIDPNDAETAVRLASVHIARKEQREARAACERALTLDPDRPEALNLMGVLAAAEGQNDAAITYYRAALERNPRLTQAHNNLGNALRELGHLAEARAAFAAALATDPASTVAYHNLAETQKIEPDDPCLAAMIHLATNAGALTGEERAELDFALAKAHADIGAHERAAVHLLRGNATVRARVPYQEKTTLGLFERIRRTFTTELIRRHEGRGDPSTTPILIVGMPRSGTTLVEQILASHPKVHGAGELMDLPSIIYGARDANGVSAHFPEFVGMLEPGALARFGAAYAESLRARASGAARVTDKLPANFLHVGLVHLALPQARIIHVRRHPLDTCLSCFAKLFANELHFTYDLAELGRYYRAYADLMAHWRDVLPDGAMLEVDYEDVVADAQTQVRRLLAYCGLTWDDACLRYYETRRPVRTASAVQVRQPIFASSIGRWKAYEPMLAPLISELRM
jgi:tetratricopeptide (TPR) repeat protein